jgi:hypothetical protein
LIEEEARKQNMDMQVEEGEIGIAPIAENEVQVPEEEPGVQEMRTPDAENAENTEIPGGKVSVQDQEQEKKSPEGDQKSIQSPGAENRTPPGSVKGMWETMYDNLSVFMRERLIFCVSNVEKNFLLMISEACQESEAEVKRLQGQNSLLQAENLKLKSEEGMRKAMYDSAVEEVKLITSEKNILHTQYEQSKQSLEQKDVECSNLRDKLNCALEEIKSSKEDFDRKIGKLEMENVRMIAELQDQNSKRAEMQQEMDVQISLMKVQTEQARSELEKVAIQVAELESRNSKLQFENGRLQKDADKFSLDAVYWNSIADSFDRTNTELEEVRTQYEDLLEQVEIYRRDMKAKGLVPLF